MFYRNGVAKVATIWRYIQSSSCLNYAKTYLHSLFRCTLALIQHCKNSMSMSAWLAFASQCLASPGHHMKSDINIRQWIDVVALAQPYVLWCNLRKLLVRNLITFVFVDADWFNHFANASVSLIYKHFPNRSAWLLTLFIIAMLLFETNAFMSAHLYCCRCFQCTMPFVQTKFLIASSLINAHCVIANIMKWRSPIGDLRLCPT